MRKTVAALTAGALITGGAMVATAQTDDGETTDPKPPVVEMERGARISSFFGEMVTQGVISQDQADTMLAELESRHEARVAEREERREAFESAFEDDVLTVAELEELGADRILDEDGPFAEALDDGQITRDEFEAIHAELGPRHHRGPGRGLGIGGPGTGPDA
jgi:hypothetical protein